MPGSLSVVCGVHEHGARAAAMLGLLRDVADEIVVAADARMDVAQLGDVAAVADRLVRYEHVSPQRALTWLHDLATCEWALLIDGDEVPGRGLLDDLPRLVAATDVQQYWLPTCWAYPDPHHWLDERPWYPDFHNRLVRNDATLRFSGVKHTIAEPVLPARYLETPLYHLDCAVTDLAARERKVARYEAARPGMEASVGGPLNERYYLPERFAHAAPVPVPPRDRELIDRVLAARGTGRDPGPIPLAAAAEVERGWAGRAFGEDGYRAALALLERDAWARPGETRPFALRVENRGDEVWQHVDTGEHPIRIAYRIRTPDGALVVDEGFRTPLPADIAPGTAAVVPATVLLPQAPGTYVVAFDLVREHVRWFGCPVEMTVTVAPQRPA